METIIHKDKQIKRAYEVLKDISSGKITIKDLYKPYDKKFLYDLINYGK